MPLRTLVLHVGASISGGLQCSVTAHFGQLGRVAGGDLGDADARFEAHSSHSNARTHRSLCSSILSSSNCLDRSALDLVDFRNLNPLPFPLAERLTRSRVRIFVVDMVALVGRPGGWQGEQNCKARSDFVRDLWFVVRQSFQAIVRPLKGLRLQSKGSSLSHSPLMHIKQKNHAKVVQSLQISECR
jgi:hypothetical protein